jgi:hypothetical protein
MLCYGFPSKGPGCSAKNYPAKAPLAPCGSGVFTKYVTKYDTKSDANPHSTKQDTQPIAFLISRQAIPYRIHGGTCCPGVSTPKIRSLADSSTTCHDGINHLHHSNCCSNHNIDPHTATSHLEGWKTTTLTKIQAKLNITKDGKTCMTLNTAWLSITNQEWTQILKVYGLGNYIKACRPMYELERESTWDQYGQGSLALLSR